MSRLVYKKEPCDITTTSLKHREGLFLVPKDIINDAVKNRDFTKLKAFNRINTLTCCKAAEHGWLGASYSCMELLTVFHLFIDVAHVILAKGHAAAGQYAVLYAAGFFNEDEIKNYKNGKGGLEAHADLVMDTGSLGQCLSSVAGMVSSEKYRGNRPEDKFIVILGDGEMQEGQIYESLMTIKKYNLTQIIPIVDINDFQSDNLCNEIMPIHNLEMVLQGFGYEVININGHEEEEIINAYKTIITSNTLTVILAQTTKAGGSEYLKPSVHPETTMTTHVWHTKVPDWHLYIKIIEEQLKMSGSKEAIDAWQNHYLKIPPALKNTHRPSYGNAVGTGKAFGYYLTECINNPKTEYHTKLAIVDADLATSCGINGAVHNKNYFELGISEQDAISFSAGLSLSNHIPVFNTYSNFLKRGFENMFISLVEGANNKI